MALAGLNAGTGIVDSKHDMNRQNASGDKYHRVCAYCHTPHHAQDANLGDYMPLWSHDLTQLNYIQYESASLNADIDDPLYGPSRLCMSCHDGVIAVDQHYGGIAGGGTTFIGGDSYGNIAVANGTGDLSNDHPIGFDYGAVVAADLGINPPSTTFNSNTKTIGDVLTDGYMTCATCHEVHNRDNVADAQNSYNYFLYAPQWNSAICTSCHVK